MRAREFEDFSEKENDFDGPQEKNQRYAHEHENTMPHRAGSTSMLAWKPYTQIYLRLGKLNWQ